MSDRCYTWGHEHFCEPDAVKLHGDQPHYLNDYSVPRELGTPPAEPTFCSVCLRWWDEDHPEGSEHRPSTGKDNTP